MRIPEEQTKEDLIRDLIKLRQRINDLETREENTQRYVEELSKTKAMFEGLFEFAPETIVVVDREGRIIRANKQTQMMFGYTREELISVDHDVLLPDRFGGSHREHRRRYMSDPHVRPMGTELELHGRRKDGSEFPVDISLGPLPMGDEIVVLALVRDVTDRKLAEEHTKRLHRDLEQKMFQLKEINKDWEMFSHAVSHELRSPLFLIDGFSRMMLKRYADKVGAKGTENLETIREAVRQMAQLLDDLYAFSRCNAQEIKAELLNMEEMVQHIFEELRPSMGNRNVQLDLKSLPSCYGDSSLFRHVFVNLFSNAIKFTEPREVALIKVGRFEKEGQIGFYVRDNGVGFDMEFKDKLFNIFQRLHSSDDFKGTGTGLAIVRCIIKKHGGDVWAESNLGEGATFYITLPSANCL